MSKEGEREMDRLIREDPSFCNDCWKAGAENHQCKECREEERYAVKNDNFTR